MEIASAHLVAQLAQTLPSPAPAAEPPALAAGPDALAAARFQSLMQAPPAELTAPAAAAQQALGSAAPLSVSLGDRILSGMQHTAGSVQGTWRSVADKLNSPLPMDTREMLQVQLQLSQVAVQYELLGKAISRSTQNIDQLVRIQ
ncbi:type III secretion system inner rod subunit SctI [Comamonas flocculans]|uniref:EscI/YscI/HrpB family type III secretion system inner rod protein n=1 Tax=Comamonas flocculans TaxID=2597701 RepID=A0A5B8RUE0_9BURK|nr:type III secretion system inner rod subunit SctI [Comamonas flocculans]QEA13166.1 EscI/YscI/HrpB family type III secretion system inner rod protein [Comamonas flocculans]